MIKVNIPLAFLYSVVNEAAEANQINRVPKTLISSEVSSLSYIHSVFVALMLFGTGFRRRLETEFFVTYMSPCVGDIAADSQPT